MKKKLSGKHKDHKEKKLSFANRSRLRRSKKFKVVLRSPGPSLLVTKGTDGKVVITNITGNIKQESYTTKIAKSSMEENKTARQAKKERIKQILTGAGFDPTIHYTRKEKKKFTRLVKKNLFVQPKLVILTKEECKVRFKQEKERKAELLASRPHIDTIKAMLKNLMKTSKAVQQDKKNTTKFRYVVQRQSEQNPIRDIDFTTDYLEAISEEDALSKVKAIAKEKYAKDDKFSGMRIENLTNNNIICYPKSTLLAA